MNEVVKLSCHQENIAVVEMADTVSRNSFSPELINGVIEAFQEIEKQNQFKVVIIHGYANYFCCGGTKAELIEISEGEKIFSDSNFYKTLLDCKIPVISAMQGHALGAGLVFGCYADFLVMAEECFYSTNFMKYGFTPGFGATYIIPKKFGQLLGTEMLFSAQNYHGGELRERGASAKIVKKECVIPTAEKLAIELIDKPIIPLKLLKKQAVERIQTELSKAIDRELAMHEECFSQPEVKERIENLFGA